MGKLSKSIFFLFPALLALLSPMATAKNSNLFTEYIGALYNGVKFSDVPINSRVNFHFILAFAIDYTTSTDPPTPTNGKFGIYWDNTNFSPSAVAAIKKSHPNVKVAVSLGGATINNYPVNFTATSVKSWVDNAVKSLTSLIKQYHLDGVDIDYETFPENMSPDTFAQCIGQLLTKLKSNGVISFASIAPFDNPEVQRHYQALWRRYSRVIDYVNFQFYAYSSSTTVSEFLRYYRTQTSNYKGGKVLASFISGANSGGLSPANGFFNATAKLQSQGSLPGIFVWSADSSYASKVGFQYEIQAQKLLAGAY